MGAAEKSDGYFNDVIESDIYLMMSLRAMYHLRGTLLASTASLIHSFIGKFEQYPCLLK